uniref:Uncharacterized protein n=1 Tax=Tanacetum cinerariifolium TaxID=118510 RepID=A0A6L2NB95_TANCI|nr:hypothetical protein [Tanacetum cinerariifolium]
MDTLREVSEYLNELENMLDDGDSTMKVGELIEVGETELEKVDAMDIMVTKEEFIRFSTPCGVEGNGAWDAELNMAYCDNNMTEEMLNMIGFIRLDYGDYGRKMVRDVRVEIHGYDFHVDFVVLEYEDNDVDTLLMNLIEDMVKIGEMGNEAYLANFLVLDIPADCELTALLGRPFLRTCYALIDMGRGAMTIDDGVIKHTYYPKPKAKDYLENFDMDEDGDWLSCSEVGRDEDGNPKYGLMAPSFLDIEVEMEWALDIEKGTSSSSSSAPNPIIIKYARRLMTNDEGFNYEAYWKKIGKPTTRKKKSAEIRKALGIKEKSEICGGHFVTKIATKLGYYNERELARCSEPIKSESWDDNMFKKAFDRKLNKLSPITPLEAPPQVRNLYGKRYNAYEKRLLLDYTVPILHYLADEAGYTIPAAFDPPSVPPYPYHYVPYLYPHTHYPDMGNSSYGGGHEIGGYLRGVQEDDDDDNMSDQFMHSEDLLASDDDMDD